MRRFFAHLPRGRTLPREVWAERHRMMVWLVWFHVAGLAVFGLAQGYSAAHSLLDVVPLVAFGALACVRRLGQRLRATCVAVALLTSSAVLVHVWGGATEAHFHFFVMIACLAL